MCKCWLLFQLTTCCIWCVGMCVKQSDSKSEDTGTWVLSEEGNYLFMRTGSRAPMNECFKEVPGTPCYDF